MKQEKSVYGQEMHSAGPEDLDKMDERPKFEIRISDSGGGEYVVLNVFEWAIDTPEQVDAIADAIKAMLKECVE